MIDPAQHPQLQFERIRSELHTILGQQPDIGVLKIVSGWLLDRGNPFDLSSRRKPKPQFVIVLGYLVLQAAAFAVFNRG
jgi:hypothetical protein